MALVPRLLALALLAAPLPLTAATVNHELSVVVEPAKQRLEVTDRVRWPKPPGRTGMVLDFELHAGLEVRAVEPYASLQLKERRDGPVPIERYSLKLPPGRHSATLEYGGRLHHGLATSREGRGRVQDYTVGHIASDGVYLDGNSYWYPRFENATFGICLGTRDPCLGILAAEALGIMENNSITALIVEDDDHHPIGVLHMHDLLRAGVV